MNNATERQIEKIYWQVFKKIFTPKVLSQLLQGSTVTGQNIVRIVENSKPYQQFAAQFSIELAKKGLAKKRGVWRKYYQAAKAVHYVSLPPTYKAFEYKIFSNAVKQNFTMIKTIPQEMIRLMEHKYVSTLMEEVAKGTRSRGSFEKELRKHGAKNAKVIARTEAAKLQTAIDRQRALDIGSVCYRWVASKDQRTRQSHRDMDGVIVFWMPQNRKPLLDGMRGDAGEFPNCRCDDKPITYPIINDLPDPTYRVYDPQVDQVVKMTRKQLIERIRQFTNLDETTWDEYVSDVENPD